MKKILISLAVLSMLVGCSSVDKTSEITSLESSLSAAQSANTEVEGLIDGYKSEINSSLATIANLEGDIDAIEAFVNPEEVFNKNGVIIRREQDKLILVMPTDVVFDFDKAVIKDDFKPLMDTVAEALEIYKAVTVSIEGHTDNVGTYDYNLDLSKRRAASAKAYLASKGVADARIETEGYSFSKPVAANATLEGRAKNRRIEVVLLNTK